MRYILVPSLAVLALGLTACSKEEAPAHAPDATSAQVAELAPQQLPLPERSPQGLVWVEGGAFRNINSNFYGTNVTLSGFYISRYEVTQKEWAEVMGGNPATFQGDELPVETVSWYDCIEYCNARSIKEGLTPYYTVYKHGRDPQNYNEEDEIAWTVRVNAGANGYRLPTEAEWEYAASGGQQSRNRVYSGSDEIDAVAWFWQNSGDEPLGGLWNWPALEQNNNKTKPVGQKAPNELGLHDMSGNVREWCWDWIDELEPYGRDPQGSPGGGARVWKGGGWMGGDFCCEPAFRSGFEPYNAANDQGFRVCRNGDGQAM